MSPALATRYFDGSPGRELVTCPDCGEPAVANVGGNHGGPDVCARRVTPTGIRIDMADGHERLAELIIRQAAERLQEFSANATRTLMDERNIPASIRTKVFRRLVGQVMVPTGYEPSTERARRGKPARDVRTYRSLIYKGAVS